TAQAARSRTRRRCARCAQTVVVRFLSAAASEGVVGPLPGDAEFGPGTCLRAKATRYPGRRDGPLCVRSVLARRRPAAAAAVAALRRRLTVLPCRGEARRQVGSQGTTRALESGRRGRRALRRAHPTGRREPVVAADRAERSADDARPRGDPRARL